MEECDKKYFLKCAGDGRFVSREAVEYKTTYSPVRPVIEELHKDKGFGGLSSPGMDSLIPYSRPPRSIANGQKCLLLVVEYQYIIDFVQVVMVFFFSAYSTSISSKVTDGHPRPKNIWDITRQKYLYLFFFSYTGTVMTAELSIQTDAEKNVIKNWTRRELWKDLAEVQCPQRRQKIPTLSAPRLRLKLASVSDRR